MVIIIEGIDRVGKDTQIKLIKNIFSKRTFHTFHYSTPPKILSSSEQKDYSYKLYKQMFDIIYQNPRIDFIFNRSHLGEYVYAQKYRNYSGEYVWNLEHIYMKREDQYLILLVNSDIQSLIDREDSDSLSNNRKDIEYELNRFKEAFERTKIKNKILIDVAGLSIDEVHSKIKEFLI